MHSVVGHARHETLLSRLIAIHLVGVPSMLGTWPMTAVYARLMAVGPIMRNLMLGLFLTP